MFFLFSHESKSFEDFGSGDESFDDDFDEELKPDIFEDEDDFEDLKCKILSS